MSTPRAERLADHGDLLADTALIGLPEELLKALPVVVAALVLRRRGVAPRDLLFLAAVSGLAFGAVEAVDYAVLLDDYSGVGTALVLRFATDPIQHALWAGVAGYFLGLATHQLLDDEIKQQLPRGQSRSGQRQDIMAQPLGEHPDVAGEPNRLCLGLPGQCHLSGQFVVWILTASTVELGLQRLTPGHGTFREA